MGGALMGWSHLLWLGRSRPKAPRRRSRGPPVRLRWRYLPSHGGALLRRPQGRRGEARLTEAEAARAWRPCRERCRGRDRAGAWGSWAWPHAEGARGAPAGASAAVPLAASVRASAGGGGWGACRLRWGGAGVALALAPALLAPVGGARGGARCRRVVGGWRQQCGRHPLSNLGSGGAVYNCTGRSRSNYLGSGSARGDVRVRGCCFHQTRAPRGGLAGGGGGSVACDRGGAAVSGDDRGRARVHLCHLEGGERVCSRRRRESLFATKVTRVWGRRESRDPARLRGHLATHNLPFNEAFRQQMHGPQPATRYNANCVPSVCSDFHPDPSGAPRRPSAPNPASRAPQQPSIVPVRSGIWQHKFPLFAQLAAHAHRRSRATPIEMNAFNSPTRLLVRHLHHMGEQRQVNDLRETCSQIEPHDVRIILW